MANFNGYLLQFGDTVFPHKYIAAESYTVTPAARTELSSYRDNNNLLHVTVSPKFKTKLSFSTLPNLNLTQKKEIQAAVASGCTDSAVRKYTVTYWDDDTNTYKTSSFKMDDIDFKILKIKAETLFYDAIIFKLEEF